MSLNKKRIAGHIGLFCGLLAVLYLALVWNLRLSLEYQPVFLLPLVLCPPVSVVGEKGGSVADTFECGSRNGSGIF